MWLTSTFDRPSIAVTGSVTTCTTARWIALASAQHPEKGRYNGGISAYSGHECVGHWETHILRAMSSSSPTLLRDQPSLKMTTESSFYNVTHLSAYTDHYFKHTSSSFRDRSAHPYASVQFTGESKLALKRKGRALFD